jgi:hypothetical protein
VAIHEEAARFVSSVPVEAERADAPRTFLLLAAPDFLAVEIVQVKDRPSVAVPAMSWDGRAVDPRIVDSLNIDTTAI